MDKELFSDVDNEVEPRGVQQTSDKLLAEAEGAPVVPADNRTSAKLELPEITLFDSSEQDSGTGAPEGDAEKSTGTNPPADSSNEKDGEPEKEEKPAIGDAQKPAPEATDAGKATLRFGAVELTINVPVGGEYVLERGKDGINFPGMSRRHAVIGRDEKGLFIRDLNSTNGTFVVADKDSKERKIGTGEKIYLADVVSLRFANSPQLEGGKAPKAAEPLRVAGLVVPHPDKFQQDLAKGEIVGEPESKRGGNSGHEKYTGKVKAEDGTTYNVYLRNMNQAQAVARVRKELAAYDLNKMLGFDNGFPPTSVRRFEVNGEQKFGSVQVSAGEDFNLEMEIKLGKGKDIPTLMKEDPRLRREIEQAFLERLIYGDHDAHAGNFRIVPRRGGGVSVVNIDLDHAFAKNEAPIMETAANQGVNEELFKYFSNSPISKEFKDKFDRFVKQYDNEEGRKQLKALGLSGAEADALLSRVRWFAEKGKFPEAVSMQEGAKQREVEPTDPVERRKHDIEKTRVNMGLSSLTRTGETGTEMVARISLFSEEVMKSSGLWEELMKPGPTVDKLKQAFEKANTLHDKEEAAPRLSKRQIDLMNEAARTKVESGLQPRSTEQVLSLLRNTASEMSKADASPAAQAEFEKLVRLYAEGNPEVQKIVHDRMGLRVTGKPAAADKPAPVDASVRDYEKEALPPVDRAAQVARIIEKGVVRDLLRTAGIPAEEAKRLEKELLSENKEVREKARAAIERTYKGGYKAFLSEAKGKLGAAAIVVGAILPELIEVASGK
ncbi:MAG: FHA domain-containing protein [Candidatus Obscuribacterales bacterium]|nr:FHA domain-containing protein [Candidatus Obscuribacterales bacterium]